MTHVTERLADAGAVTSGVGAAATWVVTANEYLQLVATIVAIASGIAALIYHLRRLKKQ